MSTLQRGLVIALLAIFPWTAFAGIRGPGTYSGTVIFDRWDGCTLCSSIYVMYISESMKEKLRQRAGQCISIDAKDVAQPMNPGDGLISKFEYLGAPKASVRTPVVEGLSLEVAPAFKDGERPRFKVLVRNVGDMPRTIEINELAPTVLMSQLADPSSPSDGPSVAIITRQSVRYWADKNEGPRSGVEFGRPYTWRIDTPRPIPATIKSKEGLEITISFELEAGEYDFLMGYGGGVHEGPSIVSNLQAFDVDGDGKATLVKVKNRQ